MEELKKFPLDTKILVVDDSPIARDTLVNALNNLGYVQIKTVKNGFEAQKCMMESGTIIHLVFSDIQMPTMTGLAFITWIRSQPQYAELPVIMLTSSSERTDLVEAIKQKVSQYLLKPFSQESLVIKMAAAWERHGRKYIESTKKV